MSMNMIGSYTPIMIGNPSESEQAKQLHKTIKTININI